MVACSNPNQKLIGKAKRKKEQKNAAPESTKDGNL